ncbi:EIF4A1 isoform 21 [Pongo abelii]|uniref:EIF4A1 isoform 21 n=1 Tax=Pongo abelii TaxID=9601 RepID=A0A2J8RWS6_PONAB|nr:EIF4A1 isoform 21 [Pongo abelii]
MRWPGRSRALYKLSIGGHSALVSKDHVCEPGFPIQRQWPRWDGARRRYRE